MAQNLEVNGVVYNEVESLEMTTTEGKKVLYFEGKPVEIVHEAGDSEETVMSQKAVTKTIKAGGVPDYVQAEAAEMAGKVLSHQSENCFTLAWLSDLHIGNSYKINDVWTVDETSNIEAGQGLHEMSKTAPCDVIALGGDLASGTITMNRENGLAQLDDCIKYMRPATFHTPTIYMMGNHDDVPFRATADRLTKAELFSRLGRKNLLIGAVTNDSDPGCNYGYVDFPNRKMRVIYLDTHDKTGWESTNCGSGEAATSDYMNACNIGTKQLDFFANVALDFSKKENPSEWGIIVLSHTQLDIHSGDWTYTDATSGKSYAANTDNAIAIMTAYLSKGAGSITHNGETMSYDFTGLAAKAHLYCCINGHRHCYEYREYGSKKIPGITCPNTRDGDERESADGNIYTKTPGTGESCSFNVITIDRTNGKVYADNYGAGIDREWDVVVYAEYTNLIPTSLDIDLATVYNGVGYANNMRISGYNASAGNGYVCTGIMPYERNADGTRKTVYIKGATLDTALSYCRVCFIQNVSGLYAAGQGVGGGSGVTAWTNWFTIEELGDQYYKLTPTDNLNNISVNVIYFRMSLHGTGENLIITVDEPVG